FFEQFSLLLDLLALFLEIYEYRNLAPKDFWNDRREEIIDGTVGIAFEDLAVARRAGGDKNNGRMGGFGSLADQGRGFKSVQDGHLDIQQDDCEVMQQEKP